MNITRISLALTTMQAKLLEKRATEHGVTPDAMVRSAIEDMLKEAPKPIEEKPEIDDPANRPNIHNLTDEISDIPEPEPGF